MQQQLEQAKIQLAEQKAVGPIRADQENLESQRLEAALRD